MEKERIKRAMLRQEQMFRQQVQELHRVYRVQKQLMMQMQLTEMKHQSQACADAQARSTMKMGCQQWCKKSGAKMAALEDFYLELTLGTGVGKQERATNSDSATVSSSTSAESEPWARFVADSSVNLRFQNENKRHDDQVMQSPWLYQYLSLKMA